ncbi:MAG TPA: ABC transporter substrate-binding protein [Bradyrhizobium sp.]|uniref:ABC transporter substrate-binding protein n=1 Tax=Bradyrhizobium sp. TaxID=376 RepID=UPI002BC84C96|nr:ABC transporter substrate-binding protein [Bradyrhizobium sp.]HTB04335.1 ABC transporter substrate-binding protein [Bradyrhizobium sp.]
MRRRDFILGAAGSLTGPGLVRAESRNAVPKIGFLFPGPEDALKSRMALLLEGLSGEGFHEPDQFILVARATGGDEARIVPQLKEMIAEGVELLIPTGPSCMRAARTLTRTIPIVTFDLESDPIESGWLGGYAHPGGNITGVFSDFPEFSGKWLELLKETIPSCSNVVALWDPATSTVQPRAIANAAQSVGVKTEVLEIKSFSDLEATFEAAGARRPDGLLILSSPIVSISSKQIAELALIHRLPAISLFANFARSGGLISYGPNLEDLYRETAAMAGKILKGAKAADLPAERPTRFDLVVNLKTAKALNLTMPTSMLLRADEVIE